MTPYNINSLPFDIWRRVAFEIYREPYRGEELRHTHNIYLSQAYLDRQQELLGFAGVHRISRAAFLKYIYLYPAILLDKTGAPSNGFANNKSLITHARALRIKINAFGPVSLTFIITQFLKWLPKELPRLEWIAIEAATLIENESSRKPIEDLPKIYMPRLNNVHVICGHCTDTDPSNMLAPAIAEWLATMSTISLTKMDVNWNLLHPGTEFVATPLWVDSSQLVRGAVYQSSITTLIFNDMELINEAPLLIRASRSTLEYLTFLCCDYSRLRDILYLDEKPLSYPRLKCLYGALSYIRQEKKRFAVPRNAFPNLEYVYEMFLYKWQHQARVVSQLLISVLSTICLPRLRNLRIHASRTMHLNIENLPALTQVHYYTMFGITETIGGKDVVENLQNLLAIPSLRYLKYEDQLPTTRVVLSDVGICCLELVRMDLRMVMMSYDTIVRLFNILKHLQMFMSAINNTWYGQSLRRMSPLSKSVQLLRFYVVGDYGGISDRSPVEEIVVQLPTLLELRLYENTRAMKALLNQAGDRNLYEWSAHVAKHVKIKRTDI
ncbi:hypothetical protein COEREDRAFT_80606, partial [Coemansia reversa NRRL 1564]